MQDCLTTTIAFTLTNIIQFGIVIKVLTPPAMCYISCLMSALTGSTLLPCFITMEHTLHSRLNWIYRTIIMLTTSCIPFAFSVGTRVALNYCFDENWYVWLVQGSTVPAMFWATYKMLFGKPLIHDIVSKN
jgi:predicted membrane channel-forming protein YqfA (hemolysin III family)